MDGLLPAPNATDLLRSARAVRILLCDDHEVVREGLRTLLAGHDGFRVVAEAATAAEAVELAAREQPDIVIMDARFPDGSGVEACRAIREILPATRAIMLTSYPDRQALYASILAGASGYLLKNTRARAVVQAIETVVDGRDLIDPVVVARVRGTFRHGATDVDPALASLTEHERLVLEQLATGKTDREVAGTLSLSEKTMRNYVSRILDKLGLYRRTGAVARFAHPRPDVS